MIKIKYLYIIHSFYTKLYENIKLISLIFLSILKLNWLILSFFFYKRVLSTCSNDIFLPLKKMNEIFIEINIIEIQNYFIFFIDNQHGFRKSKFIDTNLVIFYSNLVNSISNSNQSMLFTLIQKKFFDSVNHRILHHKFYNIGFLCRTKIILAVLLFILTHSNSKNSQCQIQSTVSVIRCDAR